MSPVRESAAVLTGTDAASYSGVVEAGSTMPIADSSPKTPSHGHNLRPRLPKSGTASPSNTISSQRPVSSGRSSIRGTDAASYSGVVEAGSTMPITDNSPKTPSHGYNLRPRLPKSGSASPSNTISSQRPVSSGRSSIRGTDAASYSGVVEAGSTMPIADNSPKTPSHGYNLRPRRPRSGTTSSSSTSSSEASISSGGSSTRGDLDLVDTPGTDVSRSDRPSCPSPEGSQSEIEYFDTNLVARTSDDEGRNPSTPEVLEDVDNHDNDLEFNTQSTSFNGTAADGSPSLRGRNRRQPQQNNRARGVNRRSTQVGDDNYKGFPGTSEVVDAPEDGIRRHDQGFSDELDEQPVEAPPSPADVNSDTIVVAVLAHRSEEEGTESPATLGPRPQSKNTQNRLKSPDGRLPLPGEFGSSSDAQAETAPEQNGCKSRAKAKNDLSLPSLAAARRQALPNLTSHDEAQAVETALQSQVLEAPSAPSDNEELHEEHSALMSGALDPSISGDDDVPSPSPEIINSPEDVPAAQWPILPRKNPNVLSAERVKNNILDLVDGKNKSKKESDWNPLVALIRILQTPKWVLQPLGIKPLASLAGDGYIYIFKSAAYPGYVKIGVTRRNPNARKDEWEFKCKFKAIHIKDPNDHRFWNSRIVESLVHTELYNEQRTFRCAHCKKPNNEGKEHHLNPDPNDQKTKHGEWFEITETRALEVVNKWRNWAVTHEPYTVLDTLRPFWVDRCQVFRENGNDDLEGFFTIDRIAYEGFISRSFKNAMRFVAPVLLIALTSPSFVWVPGYIFFRFGFDLYGWGILLLVCLSFSAFMWKYF